MEKLPGSEYLSSISLFQGMTDSEIEDALKKLSAYVKSFEKDEFILNAGFCTDKLGLVIDGRAIVETNDMWGNRTILSLVEKDELFAETYAVRFDEPMTVDVRADGNCIVLFIRAGDLIRSRHSVVWQDKMIRNLLMISAQKNIHLSGRIYQISNKSARGRIMAYLSAVSIRSGKAIFDIPFNRQQMADYLNLDRTALSKELGKMKKEGLIDYHKNVFRLRTMFHDPSQT